MSNSKFYAYNVYVGRYWNGHWFCAKRKDAVPVDATFWQRYDRLRFDAGREAPRNIILVRPNAKPLKRR